MNLKTPPLISNHYAWAVGKAGWIGLIEIKIYTARIESRNAGSVNSSLSIVKKNVKGDISKEF